MNYNQEVRSVFGLEAEDRRPLFSFWTHFPEIDLDARKLARASLDFHQQYQVDFLKTMPNGMYAIEDYGCDIDYSEVSKGGVASITYTPFHTVEDWSKLKSAPPTQGALKRELESLSLILNKIGKTPVIFTVFSPMTILNKLSQGRIYEQIKKREKLDLIHSALALIAHDVRQLCDAAIESGATGVFFAHQDTDRQILDLDTFNDFAVQYDYEAICGARKGQFNILHLHGDSVRFLEVSGYPVNAINWHAWESMPSVSAACLMTNKCLVGGLNRKSITHGDRYALQNQIDRTLKDSAGNNVILSPGCTIRHPFNQETLQFVREYINVKCH